MDSIQDIPLWIPLVIIPIFLIAFVIKAIKDWAPNDHWFTLVGQDCTKAIVDAGGKLVRFVHNRKGERLDENYDFVPGEEYLPWYDRICAIFGMRWVGAPRFRKVYKYNLERKRVVNETTVEIEDRKEEVADIYKMAQYTFEVPGIELQGNYTAKFITRITVKNTNPYKYLWGQLPSGQFIHFMSGKVSAAHKDYGGTRSFDKIREEAMESKESVFAKAILSINETLPQFTGLKAEEVELLLFDPDGASKEQKEALVAKETMRLKKNAEMEGAELDIAIQERVNKKELSIAENDRLKQNKATEAEAKRLKDTFTAVSEISRGTEMFVAEQIAKSDLLSIGSKDLLLTVNPKDHQKPKDDEES